MTYYLPINSTSLSHYFVCACVKPAKYIENKLPDIQDRFQTAMLLSTELGTKDTDCCVELVLTKDEEKILIPCGKGFYLLNIPLPISRIKSVFFRDQRQLEQTLSNINISAAFMPRSLAKVAVFSNVEVDNATGDDKPIEKDYAHSLEMYDRILGALALMRTAKKPYMNYSENYASTLSFFNSLIREDLEKQGRKIDEKFFGLFSRTGNFLKFIPYLEKKISKEDLDQIAAENNQRIVRSISKTIKYDELSGITYAFAILQSYGVGGEALTKKIDGLITTNFEELKDGKAEGIALYYGYNRGYSVFNNSYGTAESGKHVVKFLLDSKLDYYTIESVYQFAFNANTTSMRFPYIDDWCPDKNQKPKRKKEYLVLDTVFIDKKKPSVFSKEYFQGYLEEIRTLNLDFITTAPVVLLEFLRNKVANDAKEEIEDAFEPMYLEAQTTIEQYKGEIASQKKIILDLQKQNEGLVKEIESLKSNTGQYTTNNRKETGILQEPEVKYGLGYEDGSQNDLLSEEKPLNATSNINSYSLGKKGKKVATEKNGTLKSKPSKKAKSKIPREESNNGLNETQTPSQVIMTKQPSNNGGNHTLFDDWDERSN